MIGFRFMRGLVLAVLCMFIWACDGDETIPAEVYITSTFVPTVKQYESTTDIWALNVLSCAGWTGVTPYNTTVVSDFTSTENSYKLEMRGTDIGSVLWMIRIKVLDHISEFNDNEKRSAVVEKMCYYLKDEPDYDTDDKWVRITLEQPE